jgi:glucoamylase
VTSTSLAFFQSLYSSAAVGTYASTTNQYRDPMIFQRCCNAYTGIQTFADGFIAVNAQYTPSNGALSEQYTRAAGVPTSAADLTWSYASALTAFQARAGSVVPASWGASGLTLPSTCSSGGSGGNTVAVTFNEYATTVYGGMHERVMTSHNLTWALLLIQRISISPAQLTLSRTGHLITHSCCRTRIIRLGASP